MTDAETYTTSTYSPAAAKQRLRSSQGKPIVIAVGGTAGGVFIRVSKQAVYDLLATGEISADYDAVSITEGDDELLISITDRTEDDIRTPAEQRAAGPEWTDDLDDAYHDSRADL